MPFKSKAQQRFMFATDPEKAKEWAKETEDMKNLPEKTTKKESTTMNKKAEGGMFFEKGAKSASGRFLEDLPGRDSGDFFKSSMPASAAASGAPVTTKPATGKVNMGATGAPVGGQGYRGEGMSGGMYGTGDGDPEKTAGKTPNDWDQEGYLPSGYHRPSRTQPEAQESGGERFHDSEAEGPNFHASEGQRHGLKAAGSLHMAATSGHNMGKHASEGPPRFLGTSFEMKKEAGLAGEFGSSLRRFGEETKESLSEGAHSITKSPTAAALLTGLAGLVALRGGKRGYRGIKKALTKKKVPVKVEPKGFSERLSEGAKNLIDKIRS